MHEVLRLAGLRVRIRGEELVRVKSSGVVYG